MSTSKVSAMVARREAPSWVVIGFLAVEEGSSAYSTRSRAAPQYAVDDFRCGHKLKAYLKIRIQRPSRGLFRWFARSSVVAARIVAGFARKKAARVPPSSITRTCKA